MSDQTQIKRIEQMEAHYDRLHREPLGKPEELAALKEYMDSGLWLSDYQSDERGELPPELKRGVLSQDGLYDLLSEIERCTFK